MRLRHALVRVYLIFNLGLLKHLCRFEYVIEGLENVPKDETGIVMSKHQSAWETYYIPLIFHNLLYFFRFYGKIFAFLKVLRLQ